MYITTTKNYYYKMLPYNALSNNTIKSWAFLPSKFNLIPKFYLGMEN